MNYIKSLQNDRNQFDIAVDRAHEAIMDLAGYLNSSKFSCGDDLDGYVNVEDVKSRLINIKDALDSTRDERVRSLKQ